MVDKAVVDRIVDGAHAVLLVEDEEREYVVPVAKLPSGTTEGSHVRIKILNDDVTKIEEDPKETLSAEQRMKDKMAQLRKRSKK